MNPIDDDTLQAYVDGELDAASAARIDAALAHDAVLARRVDRARDVRAQLRAVFDPVLNEPVPARLSALLQPPSAQSATPATSPVMPAGGHGVTRRRTTHRRWFVPSAALAASVALLAVALWWWQPGGDLVRVQGGQSFAAGALTHALDESLASEPKANAPVAIGLSFRSSDGHICRTFVLRTPPARAGLACHESAGWALPVLAAATPPQGGGELRQAASALPPEVQAAVDARLRGNVFDAQQERAARDAGWR
jgi:anti-sigma-K factor RskA